VPAIIGIYSAIFPLLAYALFGSSRQLIIGPDAATCLLVAAMVLGHETQTQTRDRSATAPP
jgi:MFS superfamily sulfate permease-like transporter